ALYWPSTSLTCLALYWPSTSLTCLALYWPSTSLGCLALYWGSFRYFYKRRGGLCAQRVSAG
ncbi:MAG: hypothetical protein LIP09_14680, partial [Bacteroidales bacterium]|nr:hypothetical protein [Bacteroidales bacterium]